MRKLISQMPKEMLKFLVHVLRFDCYFNYKLFHKSAKHVSISACLYDDAGRNAQIAIIVQGKVTQGDDFALETLRIYRLIFPNATLILSTWPLSQSLLSKVIDIGVHVVISNPPLISGCANINYQVVSTNAGIRKAKELGAVYVLKTRTDQRINHPSALHYLMTCLGAFPLRDSDSTMMKARIIGISKNTFKYRIFGLSDMLQFGYLEDVEKYWDVALESGVFQMESKVPALVWKDQLVAPVPEVRLCKNFLEKLNSLVEPTLKGTAEAYARFFVIIDHQSVDLYWNKYSSNEDWHRDFSTERYELGFLDWLVYYHSGGGISFNENCSHEIISGPRRLLQIPHQVKIE